MQIRRWCAVPWTLFCSFVLATAAVAQPSPFHNQLQVNTATTGSQSTPGVAIDAIGNVFIVWSSDSPLGTDTSGTTIRGRRFDSTDPKPWPEFQINSYTTGAQDQPAIVHLPTGGFVVVWESFGSDGGDTSANSIQGQLLDAAGGNTGAQFQINTDTTGYQTLPALAADGLGNFMVVWQSSPGISGPARIAGRLYDSAGTPDDVEFVVSTETSSGQYFPAVAADADGDFIVAWTASAPLGPDTSGSSIRGRTFAGSTPDSEFTVNSTITGAQSFATAAMSPTGEFLIAWTSDDHTGPDTDGTLIRARTFGADGTPDFGDFEVNGATAGNQTHPVALRDSKGDFVIVWEASQSPGTDNDGSSLRGRRLKPDVSAFSAETQINNFTPGDIFAPSIAGFPDGGFVVAWSGYGSPGNDSSDSSIQARGFDSIFRDGFETNNVLEWSFSTP